MSGAAAGPDGPGPHGPDPRIPPQGGALAKVLEFAHRRRGSSALPPLAAPPPARPESPQERLAVQAEAIFNHYELSLTDPESLRALEAALHLVTLILDADAAPGAGRLREEEHRHLTDQFAALTAAAKSL